MEAETYKVLNKKSETKKNKSICNGFEKRLFAVFDLAIDYSSSTKFGIFIICFFELVQLISFSFDLIFRNQWLIQSYSGLFEFASKLLKIFLIEPYFKETSFAFFQLMFFVFISITLIIVILFLYLFFCIKSIKNLSLIAILVFNLFGQLYNAVILIPTLDILIPMLRCNKFFLTVSYENQDSSFCSSSLSYAYFALAIIGCVLSFIIGLLFSLFYYDIRSIPNSKKENKIATMSNRHNFYLFLVKVIIMIFFAGINDLLDETNMFLAFILFASSVLFTIIIRSQNIFFSVWTKKAYNIVSYIFVMTNLVLFFDKTFEYFHNQSFHAIFEIWGLGIFITVFYETGNKEDASLLLPSLKLGKVTDIMDRLHRFSLLIKTRATDVTSSRILEGYICTHCDSCQNAECTLKTYQKRLLMNQCNVNLSYLNDDEKVLYMHLNEYYLHYIGIFFNVPALRITYGFFCLMQLKNVTMAKMHLLMAYSFKPSLSHKFDLYRLNKAIEDEYLNINDESLNIDIASTLIFDQYFKQFQNVITQIGMHYSSFWTKFSQAEMTFSKIQSSGLKIIQYISKAFKLWKSMQNIQPNDRESLRLYGLFLTDMLNEKTLGQSYIDKSLEISSSGIQVKLFKTDINSICTDGSPICIATPNESKDLVISQITHSMTKWFGYLKMELIGKSIEILLPEVLKTFHRNGVEKYLKAKNNNKSIEQKKVACLAMHRAGYVFPIKMVLILMPSLNTDPHVGIVIKKDNKAMQGFTGQLIINNHMDIINISSQCYRLMNLTDKMIWTIKNYLKIKPKDRVNLMKLVQEFAGSSSLSNDRNEDDEYNNEEETNERKQIKYIINDPNQVVYLINPQDKKTQIGKISIHNSSTQLKFNQFPESPKKKSALHIQKAGTARNSISKNSNLLTVPKTKFNYQSTNLSLKGESNQTAVNISITPIKISHIDTGLYIVQLQHLFNHTAIKATSISQNPSTFYPINTNNPLITSKMNIVNDIKFTDKSQIVYDQDAHKYLVEKKAIVQMYTLSPIQKLKSSNLIIVDHEVVHNNDSSSLSFTSEKDDEEDSFLDLPQRIIDAESTMKKDVYNTLNFNNYANNIMFYELDHKTLMCSTQSRPTPQEGKNCEDLVNFFDQDTQEEDDYYVDEDIDDRFDKNKYEIKKSLIFQDKVKSTNSHDSINNLRIGSFIGIVIHITIASVSFSLYRSFLNKCDIYTNGLYRISSLLNYTITSADYFLDIMVIQSIPDIDRNTKITYMTYLGQVLYNNSAAINDLGSLADSQNVLSILNEEVHKATAPIPDLDPLEMTLSHLVSYDPNIKPELDTEKCTFIDATIQLMSVIYTLSLNKNLDISFYDSNVFFLCYNTINDYYLKSIEYIKSIGIVIHELTPTQNQTTIIYISIGIYALLFIALFFILRKNLIKINETVLEFLTIKHVEIQAIVKQSNKFLKSIRVMHNNDDEDDELDQEDDDVDIDESNDKDKNLNIKALQGRMRRSYREDIMLVVLLLLIFIPLEIYYVIQFVIVYSFNDNLDQFVLLYSSSYFYISNLLLVSGSVKVSKYIDDPYDIITLINKPIPEAIETIFDNLMTDKELLSQNVFLSQFLSNNFSGYYNEEIALDFIDNELLFTMSSLQMKNMRLNFDAAHAYFYNVIRTFYSEPGILPLVISDANFIKTQVLCPFVQKLCDAVYQDVRGFLKNNQTFVLVWYICVFLLTMILYTGIWIPLEVKFQTQIKKTKLLLLLIPTQILLNKKSILDILKKENMISIKK